MSAAYQTHPEFHLRIAAEMNTLDPTHKLEAESYIKKIKNKSHRAVIVLYYIFGFEQREIAYSFGITESRVCQIIKEVLDSIRTGKVKGSRNKETREDRVGDIDSDLEI